MRSGDADLFISGIEQHYADSVRTLIETIGTADGVRRMSSYYLVLLARRAYVLADCAVNIDPDAEELAETALLTARMARLAGIEPRVAMLSFSNFGAVDHPLTRKVRRATELVKAQAPGLVADGEMQLATAVNAEIRTAHFPFTDLREDANVLIFPDLQSGNLALHLLQHVGEAVVVGPVLTGTRRPPNCCSTAAPSRTSSTSRRSGPFRRWACASRRKAPRDGWQRHAPAPRGKRGTLRLGYTRQAVPVLVPPIVSPA